MNFSAWSIRNPVPAILLFVVLSVLGLKALNQLGKQNFPDIELPVITVSATLEGAAPPQLETEVARKIEDKIATIGGIEHMTTTITDGSVSIAVQFTIDTKSEEALNLVRNAVDSARSELPAAVITPTVSKVTTSGNAILTYVASAENMDEGELSWFVDNEVSKAMLAVNGVGKITRTGGVNREVQVNLEPTLMAGLGVDVSDVSAQLKRVQQDASGGRGDIGDNIQSVRTLGALHSADEVRNLDIPLGDGRHIKLSQVAEVLDTYAERTTYASYDGKPVIRFEITRSKGTSEVTVAKDVRAALQKFEQLHPQVKIIEAFNMVKPVEDNYEGSMHLLYEGALLAILVVWWFLRDWRATIIAAVALPLSMIPTFAFMQYFGFSLNVLTLLAMALVVGILVDDAIVEIENIVRHLRMGKTPYQAAMEAADEIGFAVIATTFTLVAIFLPTAFMGGIPGKFFKQFGITAAIAILGSLVVARLLTPMMSAYLLKPHVVKEEQDSTSMRAYLRWVGWCLQHRKTVVAGFVLFIVGSLSLMPLLPKGFVPSSDSSQTKVNIELQPGTPLAQTRQVVQMAEHLVKQHPEVKAVFSAAGSASTGGGGPNAAQNTTDVRKGSLVISLTDRSERKQKQSEIEADLRERLKNLPGARVTVGIGESGEKLQITLASDDANALASASQQVQQQLRTLSGVGNITSSASLQRPEVQIIPDVDKAAELGVTVESIAQVIRVATAGDFTNIMPKLNLPQRQVPIRVRLGPSVRSSLQEIAQLRVPARNGSVSLETVATVRMGSGPQQIDRMDRMRNVTFDIELNKRQIGEVMREVQQLPAMQNLPPSVKQLEAGDAKRMNELFSSFGGAMIIGVMCIYVVLVLLFGDFLQPVTILGALPLSLGGAFFALLVTHNSFSMPSVIGLLMLMGVVTKNSILLVEYTIMARKERQLSRFDAIIDGCHKRARPIIMTTIAMAAGMMPIALGWSADPSFRSPMAITVIGGLITSTLLSLVVIPVLYTYVDDLLGWLRGVARLARKHV
ncbi:efflux RND transporter permease subunit [Methylophilus sp.]|jgi:multidrug efflux pump subunit AcrB|uniref:efflux RND transporter permease subunit n=1 Tax=Methylophilus sp. TaxID=29541 RepID=UPI0011D40BF9|nr:efflux RND transporter permease subunit [Methylophilus sp.]TXI43920.1 MAG: efflux RND transporter permease subunit [Methylophilus sp.]